jgi:hypothetical protein
MVHFTPSPELGILEARVHRLALLQTSCSGVDYGEQRLGMFPAVLA